MQMSQSRPLHGDFLNSESAARLSRGFRAAAGFGSPACKLHKSSSARISQGFRVGAGFGCFACKLPKPGSACILRGQPSFNELRAREHSLAGSRNMAPKSTSERPIQTSPFPLRNGPFGDQNGPNQTLGPFGCLQHVFYEVSRGSPYRRRAITRAHAEEPYTLCFEEPETFK